MPDMPEALDGPRRTHEISADAPWLEPLREVCLALPEAVESGGVGSPSFKVREKIFAMQHGMEGHPSLWCKAPPGEQEILVRSEPERFFVPHYVGNRGWA